MPTRAEKALTAASYAVIAIACFLIATFDYGRDQGIYALVARGITEGDMPYRDVWDFKPPGIYLIYALARALFGAGQHGIRLIEISGLLLTSWGIVVLARRWWDDPLLGIFAAALAALVHAQLDFWHSAQPETFGGMLTVAGLIVGAGRDKTKPWHYLAAGVLFGMAGLLKPPLAGGGAVLALWAAYHKKTWRPIGLVLLGGVLPFALCLAWFAAKGALTELYQTLFVFTPHYTALGHKDQALPAMIFYAMMQWLQNFCSFITLGVLLALAQWRVIWARSHIDLLLGVIGIQLLGVALQGKFFPYHYAALWPVTALIAAAGWLGLFRWADARGAKSLAAVVLAMLVGGSVKTATKDVHESFWRRTARRFRVTLLDRDDQAAIDGMATVADVNAAGNRDIAAEVRSRTSAGDYVYIWGFEPHVYDMAERKLASRYIYNVPQRVDWAADATRAELMRHLQARSPAVIVVADNDVFPMVTGNAIGSREVMEKHFPELRAYLEENYGKLKRVQDFDLWVRR